MSGRSWHLIANAAAGSAARERLGRAAAVLAESGPVEVSWTSGPDEVDGVLDGMSDTTVPVAFGGDGTIHALAVAAMRRGERDRPVGILPGGTGNDLARGLGIPLEPAEAARHLLRARPTPLAALRLASADGETRRGVNALHVGVGAAASRRASSWKSRFGRLAYPLGAVVAGAATTGWSMRISTPGHGERFRGRALMAAVMVGRSIGGGTEMTPSPPGPAGHGRLLVSGDVGPLRRLGFARALLADAPWRRDSVVQANVDHLVVEADRPMPVNLDGEDLGDHARLEVTVVGAAWTGLVDRH